MNVCESHKELVRCILAKVKKMIADAIAGIVIPGGSYKVIAGTITQNGTANPTLVIMENTTGQTITATRSVQGRYNLAISGGILSAAKTWVNITQNNNNQNLYYINYSSGLGNTSNITVDAGRTDSALYLDSSLSGTPFEIRVYN